MKLLALLFLCSCLAAFAQAGETLIFSDHFNELDHDKWTHAITMSGGGNWEFEMYTNNRTNSFSRDGVLHLHASLTSDTIGEKNVVGGYTHNLYGGELEATCTDPSFYGCERTSVNGGPIINPITSARMRTAESFSFKYGRVEVRAKLPRGDWLWPAIWLLPR